VVKALPYMPTVYGGGCCGGRNKDYYRRKCPLRQYRVERRSRGYWASGFNAEGGEKHLKRVQPRLSGGAAVEPKVREQMLRETFIISKTRSQRL
jgi:hypothetical protein